MVYTCMIAMIYSNLGIRGPGFWGWRCDVIGAMVGWV
jgi:hypothetical protein